MRSLIQALKAAEKKTAEQLAQVRSMAKLTSLRKVHWFEKFNWFVSSENYLVLAGRDAQQNEQLVKKHLDKGDVYVHADLHGAATCIVKNSNPEAPVPPLTLNQVCY
jgi:predicted ribosome quality control (RQC) complex YloA/Tae2 family protein